MAYQVFVKKDAAKYLEAQDATMRERLRRKISEIQRQPFDLSVSKSLTGKSLRSARVGDLRIAFAVDAAQQIVTIIEIAPRGQIYQRI